MDAPFPVEMMPDIEKFFREVHPTLEPGQDWYPEVFATELFFPLQRPRELVEMMKLSRKAGPRCNRCDFDGTITQNNVKVPCPVCNGYRYQGPKTVMEIGADKGGGLYHWCQCLPTVKHVIGCEIRGTPYRNAFAAAFPRIKFVWGDTVSSYDPETVAGIKLCNEIEPGLLPIDVLFIDGDKLGMWKDFQAYLPLMRQPGGIVFMHDVQDDHPFRQFKAVQQAGYRTAVILEKAEGWEAAERQQHGEQPRNPHDGWLMHWAGRSCGVGVIYL